MICPDCGELANFIDDNKMQCECGWIGTYNDRIHLSEWIKAVDKLNKEKSL